MRTFVIVVAVLLVALLGTVMFLVLTTPKDTVPLRMPLTAAQQTLIARVPADADAYALIAAPAVLLGKFERNSVTRDAVAKWTSEQALPPPSLLGAADVVAWRRGKSTSYAIEFDPLRAIIVRLWTLASAMDTTWQGRTLVIGEPPDPRATGHPDIQLAAGLPEADALIVQRSKSRGAFPPIGRPSATAVKVTVDAIEIASRAAAEGDAGVTAGEPVLRSLPRGAMLAASFVDPPRVLGDVDRLIAADVDDLVGSGATLALYEVDTGTLLPRPFLAFIVPADDRHRATLTKYQQVIDLVGETVERNGELVVAFDRNSAGQYLKDEPSPVPWPSNRWALRLDPVRLIPVLRKVGDNPAVRWGTPRIHRGARDLRRWMSALEQAGSIEAASSVTGGFEELRVRVASK